MKVTVRNKLHEIAKTKKDGVYLHFPYLYAVKDHSIEAYADYTGNLFICSGVFDVKIGTFDTWERRKMLEQFLKQIEK